VTNLFFSGQAVSGTPEKSFPVLLWKQAPADNDCMCCSAIVAAANGRIQCLLFKLEKKQMSQDEKCENPI